MAIGSLPTAHGENEPQKANTPLTIGRRIITTAILLQFYLIPVYQFLPVSIVDLTPGLGSPIGKTERFEPLAHQLRCSTALSAIQSRSDTVRVEAPQH